MTSKESIIYQLKKLKGKPLKDQIVYIFTYFWEPILGVLIALALGGYLIFHFATAKEEALNVVCLNSFAGEEASDSFCREFAQAAGIDPEKEMVRLNMGMVVSDALPTETYEAIQALSAQVAAGTVDVMVGDLDAMGIFLYQDYFCDLTQVLTPQQLTQLQGSLLYIDLVYMEAKLSGEEVPTPFPDPAKPEEMEQPVPVALLLPQENSFRQMCYGSITTPIVVGLVVNSGNAQNALAFLDYILPET